MSDDFSTSHDDAPSEGARWLAALGADRPPPIDGLVLLDAVKPAAYSPEEMAVLERAKAYGAHAVFFEAGRFGRPGSPQAFVFLSEGGSEDDAEFALLHQRMWSWGGIPLVFRKTPGLVQLFRCAHDPDFAAVPGPPTCRPVRLLRLAADIAAAEPWWDASQLRNGTLWDDPAVCRLMLSSKKAAHRRLVDAVKALNAELAGERLLTVKLRRRLLILSLLIAYLEERGVLLPEVFARHAPGATRFFEVLRDGPALISLLEELEDRFNGHVFSLTDGERAALKASPQLDRVARLIEGHEDPEGQLNFWKLYSFRDLPVELISHIYQLFVTDTDVSVYTPPALVRLVLEEALSWDRLDGLLKRGEVILDPACGSGVFLVEAYKRLVLHWRSRNGWRRPGPDDLRNLLQLVHGVDVERGAIELAAFSLCLALCDALQPEEIRGSFRLFPELAGQTLHHSCFFDAVERGLISAPVGVVVGNPPFVSKLTTAGARRSAERYRAAHGILPDQQLAYLFLHDAMALVAPGGLLSMLQPYGFLYNEKAAGFRRDFFGRWDVREVLDFISVRGLFQKGGADTKVVVVVAAATMPPPNGHVLHAIFRRTGRADAEQGFEIDYYDLNPVPRDLLDDPFIWRANLLGGPRTHAYLRRLAEYRTLGAFAAAQGWEYGAGFIEGAAGVSNAADHLAGQPLLPPKALTAAGIAPDGFDTVRDRPIERPRTPARFTPPFLAVRTHADLHHDVWAGHYLAYKSEIVGFAAPRSDVSRLKSISDFITREATALQAFAAGVSTRLFTRKATALSTADIASLPYPETEDLELSRNERIVAEDIVRYGRDIVRLGDEARAFTTHGRAGLKDFGECFVDQINTVYGACPLRALEPCAWPGVLCAPFAFGDALVDWSGAADLRGRLGRLLRERRGALSVTRIARIYDGPFVFLLKPDPLRFWLRSVALRDADDMLADLRTQGF
ncbi:MAG: N-6 DNA methylase [Phenylobacterium sp.]|uniref:HsdM family class I SAM-dependent methyltransferase n=1 Tax=Phenylobacterium sp. TaxID=1871053 RepID=UPI003BB6029D